MAEEDVERQLDESAGITWVTGIQTLRKTFTERALTGTARNCAQTSGHIQNATGNTPEIPLSRHS